MTIRLVVFSTIAGSLRVYLREGVLPYGNLGKKETLDSAAKRIFHEYIVSPIEDFYFEQLYTFSFRNKSKSNIVVTYFFLYPEYKIDSKIISQWNHYSSKPDNKNNTDIIRYAVQRLRWKVEYTNVVYSLLPPEFTLRQLQAVYEAILGKKLDKRNFRKKFFSLHLLKSTGRRVKQGKARPAELFSFAKRKVSSVKIF